MGSNIPFQVSVAWFMDLSPFVRNCILQYLTHVARVGSGIMFQWKTSRLLGVQLPNMGMGPYAAGRGFPGYMDQYLSRNETTTFSLRFLFRSFPFSKFRFRRNWSNKSTQHFTSISAQPCAMDSRTTSLEVDEELRDLGHEAAWFLSSAKPGNGTWASNKNGISAARFFGCYMGYIYIYIYLYAC